MGRNYPASITRRQGRDYQKWGMNQLNMFPSEAKKKKKRGSRLLARADPNLLTCLGAFVFVSPHIVERHWLRVAECQKKGNNTGRRSATHTHAVIKVPEDVNIGRRAACHGWCDRMPQTIIYMFVQQKWKKQYLSSAGPRSRAASQMKLATAEGEEEGDGRLGLLAWRMVCGYSDIEYWPRSRTERSALA